MNDLMEMETVSMTRPDSVWFERNPKLGISSIDHLYNRLDGAYPFFFRSNFQDIQSIENWKESWVEAFEAEKITFSEVRAGLDFCRRNYLKPPTIAEFLAACRPVVDPLIAYHEALAGLVARDTQREFEWTSPAIYWAAVGLGYEIRNLTYGQIEKRWKAVLAEQMAKNEWEPIPDPVPAIGYTPQRSAEALVDVERQMRALWRKQDAAMDHRGWAKKIIDRVNAGDKTVPLIAMKNACESLGIQGL